MAELADAPDLGSGGAILVGSSPSPGIAAAYRAERACGGGASRRRVYLRRRLCLTAGMDPAPESPSDGGLAIFVAQQAIYRRVIEGDYMSHRVLLGFLHDLLKARSVPFSLLDLASGNAGCSVGALRGTKVSDYIAVDLSELALSVTPGNTRSLGCATQVVCGFSEYINAALSVECHFYWLFVSPPEERAEAAFAPQIRLILVTAPMDFLRSDAHGQVSLKNLLLAVWLPLRASVSSLPRKS